VNSLSLPLVQKTPVRSKFHYEKGRWPTLEEAKKLDKTIPVKLLLKGPLE